MHRSLVAVVLLLSSGALVACSGDSQSGNPGPGSVGSGGAFATGGATGSGLPPGGAGGFSPGTGGALPNGGFVGAGGGLLGMGGSLGVGGSLGAGGDLFGMGGALGTGGALGAGGAAGTDLGEGDGSDVVMIGDSWMNLGGVGIQQSVVKASGNKPYRQLGVPGTRMLDEVIPNQYEAAKVANPNIKTLVMTGGGNDILQDVAVLTDCFATGPACKAQIDKVGARYQALAQEAAADGVQDVIIVMYGRGTLLGAGPVEYVWQSVKPICDSAPVDCHMVDPDEVAGTTMAMRDGIHPTDAGFDQLGTYVYQLMQREGMRR